jgi:putative phage-type endonuclease
LPDVVLSIPDFEEKPMAEQVSLEQNTPEWLDYRFDHRNASEAGTVMRCNPFQTIEKLRRLKENREDDFKGNVATDYGHKWEDTAKEYAENLLNMELEPAIFKDGVYSASLDAFGILDNESVKVEIKCPYKKQDSKLWAQLQTEGAWYDVIPEHYVWQIVHQHMVCPTTRTYFFVFIPDEDFRLIECFVTGAQIDKLKAAWEAFANPDLETDFDLERAEVLVERRKQLKNLQSTTDSDLKTVEAELKRMAGETDTDFPGGLHYVKRSRKGGIDAAQLKKAGIDPDQYRKADSTYMTFVQE